MPPPCAPCQATAVCASPPSASRPSPASSGPSSTFSLARQRRATPVARLGPASPSSQKDSKPTHHDHPPPLALALFSLSRVAPHLAFSLLTRFSVMAILFNCLRARARARRDDRHSLTPQSLRTDLSSSSSKEEFTDAASHVPETFVARGGTGTCSTRAWLSRSSASPRSPRRSGSQARLASLSTLPLGTLLFEGAPAINLLEMVETTRAGVKLEDDEESIAKSTRTPTEDVNRQRRRGRRLKSCEQPLLRRH